MVQVLTSNVARRPRPKSLPHKGLRRVDKNPIITHISGNGHNPILSTTIFPHDSVDDARMHLTLGVDHATTLTTSHRGHNLVKAIHFFSPYGWIITYRTSTVNPLDLLPRCQKFVNGQMVSVHLAVNPDNVTVRSVGSCPVDHRFLLLSYIGIIQGIL
jgi:hypothetical protein